LQGLASCPLTHGCALAAAISLVQLGFDGMETPFDEREFTCFRFLPGLPQPTGSRGEVADSYPYACSRLARQSTPCPLTNGIGKVMKNLGMTLRLVEQTGSEASIPRLRAISICSGDEIMKRARYHVRQTVGCGVDTDDGVISFSSMGLTVPAQAPLADAEQMYAAALRRLSYHRPVRRFNDVEWLAPFLTPGRYSATRMNFAKRINDPHGRIETGATKKWDPSDRTGLGDWRTRGTLVFDRRSPMPGAISTPTSSPEAPSCALVRQIYSMI